MKLATLQRLQLARAAGQPVALLTWLASGEQCLVGAGEQPDDFAPELAMQLRDALRNERSVVLDTDQGRVFIQAWCPGLRMLIVGAVHIAQTLAPMAAMAGFAVTVIDPRRSFAADHRFPDIRIDSRWPDEALSALVPDARSAVVTLSHDPKLDDPALLVALGSAAFYVAALGSRRTHAARLERLRANGFDDAALARIHGPAGLDIGALTPAEIATSILAQTVATLRGRRLPAERNSEAAAR